MANDRTFWILCCPGNRHNIKCSCTPDFKSTWARTLNSTRNELSAFCSHVPLQKDYSFTLAVVFEGVFLADFG